MDLELVAAVDADNPNEHDLKITNGQLTFIGGDISDPDSYSKMVAQRVRCRWLMVRGEWYLDQRKGTPWREYIWGKAGVVAGDAKISRILRNIALDTPGVASVESLSVSLDKQSRRLSVEAELTTDLNEQVTATTIDKPFISRV